MHSSLTICKPELYDWCYSGYSPETLKYWVGVQQGQSYSWGECTSSALVGHPSSDGVAIKMPYGVDVLH